MFGHSPLYVCIPPYVWMPPVHTQHKENMLCQTKEVSICSPYISTPPCMFGCPLYVWMPPESLDVPMFQYPCTYTTYRKACFVRIRGVCMPHTFVNPLYVWTPHMFRCLQMYGASKHTGGYPNIWGHPNMGYPNIQGASKHMGVTKHTGGIQKYRGCQNIKGASKHMRGTQTYIGEHMNTP